jgi:hypothetical protein
MLKFFKFLIGLLLLPAVAALALVFAGQLLHGAGLGELDVTTLWFLGGFAAWLLLFAIFPRPIRTYVLAHELTHALWGMIMGAKVSKLRVSARGGSVTLDKSNLWITLAPYFFPFYSALALIAYLLVELAWDTSTYLPFWYALFGLTWSFHLSFTVVILMTRQPDIHEHGRLFSYALILCINLLTASALLNLLTHQPWPDLAQATLAQLKGTYNFCATQATILYAKLPLNP